jgi:hypothetical protein
MDRLAMRVLCLFGEMGRCQLDLHTLFEAAGNEPAERERVLDVVNELTRAGMLRSVGGDFYELTELGKRSKAPEI